MGRKGISFLTGLINGGVTGWKLGADLKKGEQQQALGDVQLQREQLGLEQLQGDALNHAERNQLVTNATTELVKTPDEDGNLVSKRVPRQLNLGDQLNLYEQLGQHDMKTGKLSSGEAVALKEKIRTLETEGSFDAYSAYKQSGDINDAVRMFNARGNIQLDAQAGVQETEKRDEITGMPYKFFTANTTDGRPVTFDPLETALLSGGRQGFLEMQKSLFEGRKVAAKESAERTRELREENRFQYGERRADQRDRQLDIMDRRVSAMGAGRNDEKPLTIAQQMRNLSIVSARKIVSGMSPEEIKRRTAKFSATGRENPDYDPLLAKRMTLANTRKLGTDDEFDAQAETSPLVKEPASAESRFTADVTMRGNKLGKPTPQGREVLDASGKLLGYWN